LSKQPPRRRSREPKLTKQQSLLFTRLEQHAVSIKRARADAAVALGLREQWEALEDLVTMTRPLRPDSKLEQEHADAQRWLAGLFARLDYWLLEQLTNVQLLAFGMPLPITPSTTPLPIPRGLWHELNLDVEQETATSDWWSFQDLRIVFMDILERPVREMAENGLRTFGIWMSEVRLAAMRRRNERQHRNQKRNARTASEPRSPPGTSPDNPLHVSIAAVGEQLVLKTEALRRNTRHGKPSVLPPKADAIEVGEAEKPLEATSVVARKSSGPRTLNPEIDTYPRERSTRKECKPIWVDESLHLHAWAKRTFAAEIRAKTRKLANLKRLREVHAEAYYVLNPEFDRRLGFKQESIRARDSG
jgi:hypothetical protein